MVLGFPERENIKNDIRALRASFLPDYKYKSGYEYLTLTLGGSECVQSKLKAMQFEHLFPGIFALSPGIDSSEDSMQVIK